MNRSTLKIAMTLAKCLLLAGLLLPGGNAMAQQDPIRLEHKAEQWERFTDENGVEQTRLVAAARVLPGEELLFTVTYTNSGNQSAENITIVNPVPEHMDYVLRSASGDDAAVTFSVDGGESFTTEQDLSITDAQGTKRPAAAEDYTHVRWIVGSDVAPGDSGKVQFTAIVE